MMMYHTDFQQKSNDRRQYRTHRLAATVIDKNSGTGEMWRTDWFPLNSHFLKHSFKWLMEGMLYHLDLWLLHSDRRACSWLVHQKRSVQIESFIDFLPFSLEMSFLWIAVGWWCGGAAHVCMACLNYVIANQGIYVFRNPHLLLQPPFRPNASKTLFDLPPLDAEDVSIVSHERPVMFGHDLSWHVM